MVACTFISAPLMFVSAKMITLTKTDPSEYIKQLDSFTLDVSIVATITCCWVIFVFILTKKISRLPHKVTACLVISQVRLSEQHVLSSSLYFCFSLLVVLGPFCGILWNKKRVGRDFSNHPCLLQGCTVHGCGPQSWPSLCYFYSVEVYATF